MNMFQQYGIREVADVCLYAIELDENDDEIYVPVLYLDTLKVSTVEETAEQTSAQGGRGNSKLITWDYGKEITVTLEDALFSPASQGITWGGKIGAKTLKLYLRNFVDRGDKEIDPNKTPTGAILTVERFQDFLIIPDRYPSYELKNHCADKHTTGYVGGTSIYCWLVDANIISNDGKKRVSLKNLLLFFREQTQKWYFFNGQGPIGQDAIMNGLDKDKVKQTWFKTDKTDIKKYAIGYQYGRDVFEWIRKNINGDNFDKLDKFIKDNQDSNGFIYQNGVNTQERVGVSEAFDNIKNSNDSEDKHRWTEYEKVAIETIKSWSDNPPCANYNRGPDYNVMEGEVAFLTQDLFIDGYRTDKCARNSKYSELTDTEKEYIDSLENQGIYYEPARYTTSVDVEYNTNVVPPQEAIYQIDHDVDNVFYLDRIEKCKASQRFCIDTDVNLKHGQYRYIEKYAQTELTVYLDPKTMQPYEPNTFEYYRKNGQRITGNLRAFKQYEVYYKWTRTKAVDNSTLGKQIIIDATHFPGTYRLVGETYVRNRKTGKDQRYQFEIPLCKMGTSNNLTLQSDGEPTTFTMTLTALRRADGVMMKLTQYDVVEKKYGRYTSGSTEIVSSENIYEPTDEDLEEINETFEQAINQTVEVKKANNLRVLTPQMEYLENGYYDLNKADTPKSLIKQDTDAGINPVQETELGNIHVIYDETTTTTNTTTWIDQNGKVIKTGDITTSTISTKDVGLNKEDYEANLIPINNLGD